MSAQDSASRGYGPSSRWARLAFDGDERKFEQWLVKFLGYMRLKGLRTVIDPPENAGTTNTATTTSTTPATTATTTGTGGGDGEGGGNQTTTPTQTTQTTAVTESADDSEKNAEAYAELIQFLDDRSLSLVMRDAEDDGRRALKILKEHYQGCGKPRVLSLYTELTSLCKGPSEDITDYII